MIWSNATQYWTSLQEMKCSASPQMVVLAGVRESKFLCRICDYSSENKPLPSLWQKRTDVIKHQQMAGWLPWRMKPYQRLNIGESLLLLVNRKSMSLNHEPSSPTKWPLSKSWGSWRNRLVTSTEHVILSSSLVRVSFAVNALWWAFTRDTISSLWVFRVVCPHTSSLNFFVTHLQILFFQIPDHPNKILATAH